MIAIPQNGKDQAKAANSKRLNTQETLDYYTLLLQQNKQTIDTMIANLNGCKNSKFTNDFIQVLEQLQKPMTKYQTQKNENAKIKISQILEQTVEDVITRALSEQSHYYKSTADRSQELSAFYKIYTKKRISKHKMKELIYFDIFCCAFDQNKRYNQHCCQQICLWSISSLQRLYHEVTLYQINKLFYFYEEVQQFVGFRRIWSDIMGIWTLMILKSKLLYIRKKNYQECMKYLANRQKRQKEKINQLVLTKKMPRSQFKFYLSQIVLFSHLNLDKLFPINDRQLILNIIHMIYIQEQENTKKEHIIQLVLKYRTSLSVTISLFDAIVHNIGHEKAHFYLNGNIFLLEEVFRYTFDLHNSYENVIRDLLLDKIYSITIDQSKREITAGNKDVLACWPVAFQKIVRQNMEILDCYTAIAKIKGPAFVFKRLEFSLSEIFGLQMLKDKKQTYKNPKVFLVIGTQGNQYIYSQIVCGRLSSTRYLSEIKNFIKKNQIRQNFTLIIADQGLESSFPWRNASFFFMQMLNTYNCFTFFSSLSQICSPIIILYLHLRNYIRAFRRFITEQNFQQTVEYLIQEQLKRIAQHL